MEELDLKELFYLFWNKKLEILFITILFMIVGIVYSYYFITPEYTATTSLVLVQSSTSTSQNSESAITSTDLTINSKLVSTYSEIIKRNIVLDQVANNLNLKEEEVGKIRKRVSVNLRQNTEIIEINVKNEDPKYAANVANEIATVFSEKIVDIYNISNIYLLDRAETPTSPSNINHMKDIAIFIFIGLVVSAIYVLLLNMFDHTVKTEEDIEKLTGLVVLAAIPNYEVELKKTKGGKK